MLTPRAPSPPPSLPHVALPARRFALSSPCAASAAAVTPTSDTRCGAPCSAPVPTPLADISFAAFRIHCSAMQLLAAAP
eukprot:5593509-Pleurochrysis_carterae.AAC.1